MSLMRCRIVSGLSLKRAYFTICWQILFILLNSRKTQATLGWTWGHFFCSGMAFLSFCFFFKKSFDRQECSCTEGYSTTVIFTGRVCSSEINYFITQLLRGNKSLGRKLSKHGIRSILKSWWVISGYLLLPDRIVWRKLLSINHGIL